MTSSTAPRPEPTIERARPLLGTIVSIRVEGVAGPRANALIDEAFAEIALIHRLMSYQEPESELSRINRDGATGWTPLSFRTNACLRRALDLAALSNGVFDPTATGSARGPEAGCWRDIVIEDGRLCLRSAVSIDLSGIAKGYAVDRACDVLQAGGAPAAVVNAGGDLRVFGAVEEPVALRPFDAAEPAMMIVADGALASSDPRSSQAQHGRVCHVDGRTRMAVAERFACVAAPTCADADALTKIVLVLGPASAPMLATVGAAAHIYDGKGWSTIGGAA